MRNTKRIEITTSVSISTNPKDWEDFNVGDSLDWSEDEPIDFNESLNLDWEDFDEGEPVDWSKVEPVDWDADEPIDFGEPLEFDEWTET